jgi:ribosomal protein S18 acetylase RimI-like enzyme
MASVLRPAWPAGVAAGAEPLAPAALSPAFDAALLARIEDAGLNASAPPQQRMLGGWILRLSPGKSKRARCVNALSVGSLPLSELLARAEASFDRAGLPFIVRITPFTQPASLDATLQASGFLAFDDTRVMVRLGLDDLDDAAAPMGCELEAPGHEAFAEAVGALRGSPLAQRKAHAELLQHAPAAHGGLLMKQGDHLLACGQFALEDELVGLYDVYAAPAQRRRGLATALCRRLLRIARERGARYAYLQVDANNHAARSVYARLGFVDAYSYHYRIKGEPAR